MTKFLKASLVSAGLLAVLLVVLAREGETANRETIQVQWKRAVNQPVCLAMSQGGGSFGSIDKNGMVSFYDPNGHLRWSRKMQGATDMLIARNGQSVLVYSRLNPIYQDVHFIRSNGKELWTQRVDGSVWSGAVSTDGQYAAVTTGERYIYVYKPDPNRPRYRRWRLDGIGHCVTFSPDSRRVIVGIWQDSGLVCYSREGDLLWSNMFDTELQYDLRVSGDGRTILGLLPGKRRDSIVEVCLWGSDGSEIWKRTVTGFDGRALVSPQSQYVAVSYADVISKHKPDVIERRVVVYTASGKAAWEKGGLFFGPRLVALSPQGTSVIVWDGEKALYNMDKSGKIVSKLALGGRVRKTTVSDDGRLILAYCGDGWMYLLHVGA